MLPTFISEDARTKAGAAAAAIIAPRNPRLSTAPRLRLLGLMLFGQQRAQVHRRHFHQRGLLKRRAVFLVDVQLPGAIPEVLDSDEQFCNIGLTEAHLRHTE